MSHILNLKSKYNLVINIDKQIIMDGIDSQTQSSSFISADIKLFDAQNNEMSLTSQQKDDIIVMLLKIRSINGD
jgi:hypothetical protein